MIVLGSLHAEMSALLEDRAAPLFNRTTDVLALDHLDIATLIELLQTHTDASPERLLFLWNLFEGVPKFYRDAFEQGVLGADRPCAAKRTTGFCVNCVGATTCCCNTWPTLLQARQDDRIPADTLSLMADVWADGRLRLAPTDKSPRWQVPGSTSQTRADKSISQS